MEENSTDDEDISTEDEVDTDNKKKSAAEAVPQYASGKLEAPEVETAFLEWNQRMWMRISSRTQFEEA